MRGYYVPQVAERLQSTRSKVHIGIKMTTRFHTGQTPSAQSKAGVDGVYRGIRLLKPAVPPRTPIAALREAVQVAFEQNADAIRRIK